MTSAALQFCEEPAPTGSFALSLPSMPLSERSLSRHQHEGDNVGYDRERVARNVRGGPARPLAFSITQGDWVKSVQRVLREHVGDRPHAAKALARIIECSERTSQNWLDGRNAPVGILDLRCMHAIPGYAALKREVAAMESALDPRLQAKLVEMARFVSLYGDNLFDGIAP